MSTKAKSPKKSRAKTTGERSTDSHEEEKQSPKKQTGKAQSPGSTTSPSGKFGFIKSLLTKSPPKELKSPKAKDTSAEKESRSPSKVEKSPVKNPKIKMPKSKQSPKESKKRVESRTKQPVDKEKLEGSSKETQGEQSRSLVQTSLASTAEGGIEILSSPEQPQAKILKQKSGKKSRSVRSSKKESKEEGKKQTKILDLFPSRKSTRVCQSELQKKEQARITDAILSQKNEGLEVRNIAGKGRGVFATRPFSKDEFVCEYSGELITYDEAKKREDGYNADENIGCYMYYIVFNNNKYCIDATEENGTFGRLLNHSKTDGNCKTKIHAIKNKPHLILVSKREIKNGEELTYDYGDRSKSSLDSHPWLKH